MLHSFRSGSLLYLAQRQKSRYPFVPVTTSAEKGLYKSKVLDFCSSRKGTHKNGSGRSSGGGGGGGDANLVLNLDRRVPDFVAFAKFFNEQVRVFICHSLENVRL